MQLITPVFMIASGGALGALLRYYAGLGVHVLFGHGFPLSTLVINVFGSFMLGIVAAYFLINEPHDYTRLFFVTGVLGAFTTFSTFSLDALNLWMRGDIVHGALYVLASVVLSLAAVFCGFLLINKGLS
jgi:CrcB protein